MARTSHVRSKDSLHAKRWLIIGAHKAGASEKQMARIANLSRTAIRRIIFNYQRTGSPSLPTKESQRVKRMPIVEYDEHGNILNGGHCLSDEMTITSRVKSEELEVSSRVQISTHHDTPLVTSDNDNSNGDILSFDWCPLTPPHESNSSVSSSDETSHGSLDPIDFGSSLPPPTTPSKCDQVIKGYEVWTDEDDRQLLHHVLNRLQYGRWRELSAKLNHRHSPQLCVRRWRYLQQQLLKGIARA